MSIKGSCSYRKNKEYESNIHRFRVAHGLSIKKLVELANVKQSNLSALANGMMSPINTKGALTPAAARICKALDATVEELFPRYFCNIKANPEPTNQQMLDCTLSGYTSELSKSLEDRKLILQQKNRLSRALGKLSLMEQNVLVLRFYGGWVLDRVGKLFGISRERVRQIESRALQRLRSHSFHLR